MGMRGMLTGPTGVTRAAERPSVLALLVDTRARERVRLALREIAELVLHTRVAEVDGWLAVTIDLPSALVTEATDADGVSTAALIRRLTRGAQPVPVVGYSSIHPASRRDIVALVQAGVHDLVFTEVDDSGITIRHIIQQAEQTCGVDLLLARLEDRVPDSLRPLLAYCLAYPERARTVAEVAQAMGVHRRTLVNVAQRAGFPPPQELLTWCRLLMAGYLLEATNANVENVALRVDFPTSGAMRNACRRYLGCAPNMLRERDPLGSVVAAFTARLQCGSDGGGEGDDECEGAAAS